MDDNPISIIINPLLVIIMDYLSIKISLMSTHYTDSGHDPLALENHPCQLAPSPSVFQWLVA